MAKHNLKDPKAQVPPDVMNIVVQAVQNIVHGTVVIIVQDAAVVQIEKHEKIRVSEPLINSAALRPASDAEIVGLRNQITKAVTGLKFGQFTLVVRNGKVMQVEKTEKLRFNGVEGQFGDGI